MHIGVPKEVKDHEYRVGIAPAGVHALTAAGHLVTVQAGAGARIGFPNSAYATAGARIGSAEEAWNCDLVVKVKEPQPSEWVLLRKDQVLFTYLHLAAEPGLARALVESGAVCIGYETVTDARGDLPLLIPMSEVAGRLAVLAGSWAMTLPNGGSGTLITGVAGVPPARVVIIGGGVVGTSAARVAYGLGADVTVLDVSPARMRWLEDVFGAHLKTCYSSPHALQELLPRADLVIGAVLLPGKRAPKLITRAMVASMAPGAVLVDVSIDQGGCAETSRPTSHSHPIYVEEGVVHYCVTNMPGATARTSTLALTQSTLPYVLALAGDGYAAAMARDPGLLQGLQVHKGAVTHPAVAEDLGYPLVPAAAAIR